MNKEKFKIKSLEKIDNVFDSIEEIKKKRDDLNRSMKENFDKKIKDLEQKKAELDAKYAALKETTNENWEEVKEVFTKSFNHYKAGFVELGRLFE